MGDFSREPSTRLQDSVAKHYVGVRMQQGKPILDTDWNELEDLRRHELAALFQKYIGDGVPAANDGFRLEAMEDGGAGTIYLEALTDAELSSIRVDTSASTAVSALGLLLGRFEGAPARLVGSSAEPFSLVDGATLTIIVDDGAAETVTFSASDFSDIAAATASEVVAAVNSALSRAEATASTGNDFIILGGDGDVETAGRLLVGGTEVLAEIDIGYTSQPLYQNDVLAAAWGVPVIGPLTTPVGPDVRTDLVYVDTWDREIDASEDDVFILPAVGIEATVRLRREWAVRVAEGVSRLQDAPMEDGHRYAALARLHRDPDDGDIVLPAHIEDLRKRQLTLADVAVTPMLVRDEMGLEHVNSNRFEAMLSTTSSVFQSLLESDLFLADNFDDITAVESVMVLRAFQDVRVLAESGITEAGLKRLDNGAALNLMRRLYEAQRSFVDTLMIPADNGTSKRLPTRDLLQDLDVWLEGNGADIPGLRDAVMPDASPDLGEAYDAQIFINSELGRFVGVLPRGLLDIQYTSGPSGSIDAGSVNDLTYSITSMLNMEDTLELSLSDSEGVFDFAFQGLEEDPAHPGDPAFALLTLDRDATAAVTFELIVPSSVPTGTRSRILLTATSQVNPDEVSFANVEILVEVGQAIDEPSAEVGLTLLSPSINLATDIVEIGPQSEGTNVTFTLEAENNTSTTEECQFTVEFIGEPDSYEVTNASALNPFNINGESSITGGLDIQATSDATSGEEESLMVIRLARTSDGAFQELHVRVIPDV